MQRQLAVAGARMFIRHQVDGGSSSGSLYGGEGEVVAGIGCGISIVTGHSEVENADFDVIVVADSVDAASGLSSCCN